MSPTNAWHSTKNWVYAKYQHARGDNRPTQASKWRIPVILAVFSVLLAWFQDARVSANSKSNEPEPAASLDTYIPHGFVLVPIDVQNPSSLDAIFGQYGFVDLYKPGNQNPILRSVRLIRSPMDPSVFAAMVPESRAAVVIAAADAPLAVVVQNVKNPNADQNIENLRRKIIWEGP